MAVNARAGSEDGIKTHFAGLSYGFELTEMRLHFFGPCRRVWHGLRILLPFALRSEDCALSAHISAHAGWPYASYAFSSCRARSISHLN